MPALNLTDLRKGVAANARTAAGLADAKHFRPELSGSGIAFWVELSSIERSAMGSASSSRRHVELEAVLLVQGAWDRSQQEKLDELIPVVWDAIESDRTAGGYAQSIYVRAVTVEQVDAGQAATYAISVEA